MSAKCHRSLLLGGFYVIGLEPVHHFRLVELGAHREHGVGKAARDFGDLLRRELIKNSDAHLNRLGQGRPDAKALRSTSRDEILLFACELAGEIEYDQAGRHWK